MSSNNVAFESELGQGISLRSITQRVKYNQFVDGTSTTGTMTLSTKLPAYSFPIGCKVQVFTGFTGDPSTATLSIGTSTTTLVGGSLDANVISLDTTIDVYTAGKTYIKYGAFANAVLTYQDSTESVASNYILLTITGASDFTLITAGDMLVTVYYFNTTEDGGIAPVLNS